MLWSALARFMETRPVTWRFRSAQVVAAAAAAAALSTASAASPSRTFADKSPSRIPGVVDVGFVGAAAASGGDFIGVRPGDQRGTLLRVTRSGRRRSLPVIGTKPSDIAVVGGSAWIANSIGDPRAPATHPDTIEAVDLRSSSVQKWVKVPGVYRVATAGNSLVALVVGNTKLVVLREGKVRWQLRLPVAAAQYLAASRSFAWVVGTTSKPGRPLRTSLVRIDLRTRRVDRRASLPVLASQPTLVAGTLWLPSLQGLVQLTLDLRVIRYTKRFRSVIALATVNGSLWVGTPAGELLRLDRTGTVVTRRTIPIEADELVTAGSAIWVLDRTHGSAVRVAISG